MRIVSLDFQKEKQNIANLDRVIDLLIQHNNSTDVERAPRSRSATKKGRISKKIAGSSPKTSKEQVVPTQQER